MYLIPHPTLHACRTSAHLPKRHIRSLREEGLEIEYIETVHREDGDETTIVWSRPYRPGEIRYNEIPIKGSHKGPDPRGFGLFFWSRGFP